MAQVTALLQPDQAPGSQELQRLKRQLQLWQQALHQWLQPLAEPPQLWLQQQLKLLAAQGQSWAESQLRELV